MRTPRLFAESSHAPSRSQTCARTLTCGGSLRTILTRRRAGTGLSACKRVARALPVASSLCTPLMRWRWAVQSFVIQTSLSCPTVVSSPAGASCCGTTIHTICSQALWRPKPPQVKGHRLTRRMEGSIRCGSCAATRLCRATESGSALALVSSTSSSTVGFQHLSTRCAGSSVGRSMRSRCTKRSSPRMVSAVRRAGSRCQLDMVTHKGCGCQSSVLRERPQGPVGSSSPTPIQLYLESRVRELLPAAVAT
mmetsp:Transcript_43196/g.101566  ORF Transcript_43196/g.101566 Transcript_43196/m.101566 type:complete len:251 (-) Transcript_43196:241-993(-)